MRVGSTVDLLTFHESLPFFRSPFHLCIQINLCSVYALNCFFFLFLLLLLVLHAADNVRCGMWEKFLITSKGLFNNNLDECRSITL